MTALGCSGGAEDGGIPIACNADEHKVGATCVPNVFDEASLPAASTADVVQAADGSSYLRERLIVLLRDPATPKAAGQALLSKFGGAPDGEVPFAGIYRGRFASAGTESALDLVRGLIAADPLVEAVLRDEVADAAIGRATDTDLEKLGTGPSDGYQDFFVDQSGVPSELSTPYDPTWRWAYERVRLFGAWDAIHDDNPLLAPVTVAVLDGLLVKDPAFSAVPLRYGLDARLQGSYDDALQDSRHAAAVASIIGAPNDGKGTTGILAGLACLKYDLAPIAVLGRWKDAVGLKAGPASISAALEGIVLGVKSGARVVNMSFGFTTRDSQRANMGKLFRLVMAVAPRVLFVAGAGNSGIDAAGFVPARAALPLFEGDVPNVVTVAAIDAMGRRAVWPELGNQSSNRNTTPGSVTIAAPGTRVLAGLSNGAPTMFFGTSSAAPIVAGAAGLAFAIRPELTGSEARALLIQSADTRDAAMQPVPAEVSGRVVNIEALVKSVLSSIPAERHDAGSCRAKLDNACPIGKGCRWRVDTTFALTLPAPSKGGTFTGCGDGNAEWIDAQTINVLGLTASDKTKPGTYKPFVDLRFDSEDLQADRLISRGTVRFKVTKARNPVGQFGDGTVVKDPMLFTENLVTYDADSVDFSATYSGDRLSGRFTLSGNGATAVVTFAGTLTDTFPICGP